MTVWLVELAGGRTIEISADAIGASGDALVFRRAGTPVAAFHARSWLHVRRADIELVAHDDARDAEKDSAPLKGGFA